MAPFRRETNGGVILLNELPGSSGASRAYGIYKSTVVGQSGYPPVAVQWDYYGNLTPLLHTTSTAYAINSKGHVVGAAQGPSQGNAWVWQNGSLTYLPAPGSNPWAFAYTINDIDAIGGYTYVPGSPCMDYWYASVLSTLDCGSQAQPAVGISSDGWVFGGRNASTSRCGPYFGGNSSDRCPTNCSRLPVLRTSTRFSTLPEPDGCCGKPRESTTPARSWPCRSAHSE